MAVADSPKVKFMKRESTGKGVCRKLRVKGMVPAVMYGPDYRESEVGQLSEKEIWKITSKANWETTMVNVEMPDGKSEMALLRSIQRNVLTQGLLHVDLFQLVKGHKVKVTIPVRVVGKESCPGIKMGGVFEHPLREVEIETLPNEIPAEFVINIGEMHMGSEVLMKDLPMPQSADFITDADAPVVIIAKPRSAAADEEEDSDEPKEVEVVAKGKARKEE